MIESSQVIEEDNLQAARVNQEARAMRQASEWGMRALQSSFPCLKDRMIYKETGEPKNIMKIMILLFNLPSRQVGINQILNTYMPSLERDANRDLVAPMLGIDLNDT